MDDTVEDNETVFGPFPYDEKPCTHCGQMYGKHNANDNRCPPRFRTRGRVNEWLDTFYFPVKNT